MGVDGRRAGVDFITWNDTVTEFNIFIYGPHSSGKGLVAHQFALRAYGDDRLSFMQNLGPTRREALEKVFVFQFAEIIGE